MPAIFLVSGMEHFHQIVVSFPTSIFTVLLLVVMMYWLLAILGAVEISVLDIELDLDSDTSSLEAVTGFMMRMGLNGVPVTIVISLVAIIGWTISFYTVYFFFDFIPSELLRYLAGVPVVIGSLYVAILLTAALIKPLRPLFQKLNQQTVKRTLGQVAIVRSTQVNQQAGEATFADGGAGLILKIRSRDETVFHRGDRVVLLEYVPERYFYWVISEQEFMGLSVSE